ncbi:hypothetical protein HCN44_000821 [Aphidius gifuensis]|uniref:AP180 N-terminal homology (ANTH) domain-containing protein n=1 Tax=Aphidius gifuensis TaxID=684658 RepID=A0A834XQG6_APHGI|nr:hypothetical protein HCN44_000821 [Aphidius gifuensis]
MEMSTVNDIGVMEVKQEVCERLLSYRVDQKIKTKKVGGLLNRLHVALPAACVSDSILAETKTPERSRSASRPSKKRLRFGLVGRSLPRSLSRPRNEMGIKDIMKDKLKNIAKAISKKVGKIGNNCHVLHKTLREGHPCVIINSQKHKNKLENIEKMWQHLKERYRRLIHLIITKLITKLEFDNRNPGLPGNLQVTNDELKRIGENDINIY